MARQLRGRAWPWQMGQRKAMKEQQEDHRWPEDQGAQEHEPA